MQINEPIHPGAGGAHEAPEALTEPFRWLPHSRVARALLALAALLLTALVFVAYLHPGMAFDLANMVFCG